MADTPAHTEAEQGTASHGSGEQLPEDVRAMSFEQALQELRQIVERLEKGEGKLDDAIAAYERGALLKRHCEQKLREAEAKIEKIKVDDSGSVGSEPLDVE
jgi:exodeoxyribonuclease VII small subunit